MLLILPLSLLLLILSFLLVMLITGNQLGHLVWRFTLTYISCFLIGIGSLLCLSSLVGVVSVTIGGGGVVVRLHEWLLLGLGGGRRWR